jgi:hypothetical protein
MNVFIKPRPIDGQPAIVRDPSNGKPLSPQGEWKTKSQFWIRRIMQGDVIDETQAQTDRQVQPSAVKELPAPQAAPAAVKEQPAAAPEKPTPAVAEKMPARGNPTSAA